jgi:hypothetical protein
MVNALTTSMMIDSPFTAASSLHAIAEVHIANGQRKKRDRDRRPNHIFHFHSP